MNIFSPSEVAASYADIGAKKASMPVSGLILPGILAGVFIAMGSAAANTATHAITNISAAKVVSGLLFPFGLGMVMLMGAELFTGNCMLPISVLERKAAVGGMLRNWTTVYISNFTGAVLIAAGCAYFGQLNYSDGMLAAYTIKIAAARCSMPFANAVVMGIFCNILVCTGVLCAISAKDTAGKIMGAFIPVSYFVFCGFEHCVANMYFVPAGLFANQIPVYAAKAAGLNINTEALTWSNFIIRNLIPVTAGNIIGGGLLGFVMWFSYLRKPKKEVKSETVPELKH